MTGQFDWQISEHTLEADTLPQTIHTRLDQVVQGSHREEGSHKIWETKTRPFCKVEVDLDVATGEITVSGYSTFKVKRVAQLLIFLAPFVIGGIVMWRPLPLLVAAIPVYSTVPLLLVYNHTPITKPLDSYTTITGRTLTPYIFGFIVVLIGVITAAIIPYNGFLAVALFSGLSGFLVFTTLLARPFGTDSSSVGTGTQLLFLLDGFKIVLLPFGLFMGILLIPIDHGTVNLMRAAANEGVFAQSTSAVLIASVVLTGLVLIPGILDNRYTWMMMFALPIAAVMTYTGQAFVYAYYTLPIVGVLGSVNLFSYIFSGNIKALNRVKSKRLPDFQSPVTRFAVLGVYIVANLLILVVVTLILTVFIPGISVSASILPISPGRVETVMALLAVTFKPWPLFPPAAYRAAFLLLLAAPVIGFAAAWLYNVAVTVLAKTVVLARTTPCSYDSDAVPDSVQIRRLPGDMPEARPVTVFFGVKQFVVVGEVLFDELSEEELDAVIAHEAYHLLHRDWTANLIASILAGLFGGKNALLVFYKYPQVEQMADRYAVEEVGQDPLIRALQTIDLLWKRAVKGGGHSLQHAYPGFTRGPREEEEGFIQEVKALYKICFGSVLLDAAHPDVEDRIEQIEEMEEQPG